MMFDVLLLLFSCVLSAQSSFIDSITINNEQKNSILNTHNSARAGLCLNNLTYDDNLGYVASMYSEKCILEKNTRFINLGNGENIQVIGWPDLTLAVWSWIQESNSLTCGQGYNSSNARYAQIINEATTRVGCGASRCLLNTASNSSFNLVVCNYSPGLSVENSNRICHSCENGKTANTSTATSTATATTPTATASLTTTVPTIPTSTTIPTTVTSTSESTTTKNNQINQKNSCLRMRNICWEQCGKPEIFPFLDSCTEDLDGKIIACVSAPGCLCTIPDDLMSSLSPIKTCNAFTCKQFFPIAGTLNWCRQCGYNCGGFQDNCIKNEGFCKTPTYCSRLNMCQDWRESNCKVEEGIEDTKCGQRVSFLVEDQIINTNVNTTVTETESYKIALGIAIAICAVISLVFVIWICTIKILEKKGVRPVMSASKVQNPDFELENQKYNNVHANVDDDNQIARQRTSIRELPISRHIHVEDSETHNSDSVQINANHDKLKRLSTARTYADGIEENSTYD